MTSGYTVPDGLEPLPGGWDAASIERLAGGLATTGGEALRELSDEALFDAWCSTVDELLDPRSPARRSLDPALAPSCGLSRPALEAALQAMLTGFTGPPVRRLIERYGYTGSRPAGPAVAVLASNVPGLAVQVVLPALVARRPLLIKSSSREPLFAPLLVRCLAARSRPISRALAAVTWSGGDLDIETPVLAAAERLAVYGHAATLDELRGRFDGEFAGLGPKLSIGIVSREADAEAAGRALARDVALFEQRGCLSVQTVFTDGDPSALAAGILTGLTELAELWPPGVPTPALAARIQQLRQVAELGGERVADLPLRTGTVLTARQPAADRPPELRPLPGGRTVRIQPVHRLEQTEVALERWRDGIQGAALAGSAAWRLAPALGDLGLTRLAEPGQLQYADALWANGERHLVDFFRPRESADPGVDTSPKG